MILRVRARAYPGAYDEFLIIVGLGLRATHTPARAELWTSGFDTAPGSYPLPKNLADHAGQPSDREEKREEYGHHHGYQNDALGASRQTIEGQQGACDNA